MDSYRSHKSIVDPNRLKKYNIHIVLVPENLTRVLQPLDIKAYRSFQLYYKEKCDEYISKAISYKSPQKKSGTLKLPNYRSVAQWI